MHLLPGDAPSNRAPRAAPLAPLLVKLRPLVALATLVLGCGEAALGDAQPLTIAECHELGGSPLFDPEDERPIEASCPESLRFLGEFDEPFFGADGGICCGGAELSTGTDTTTRDDQR